ncbi:MAG: replication initiation factor domain-containing protein [Candidatus Binataceae bacterium]|nr:replication initiation factor domain-containing protein [Candidatus Binataceae bacterium]
MIAEIVSPPPTSRGAEITTTASIDWLEFTTHGHKAHDVRNLIAHYLNSDLTLVDHGRYRYDAQFVGPGKSCVMWSPRRDDVHVALPGEACHMLGEPQMRGLMAMVHAWGAPTRIDLAMDFAGADRMKPAQVFDAVMRGEYVGHVRRENRRLTVDAAGGATFSCGKRGSNQYLRVYDKEIESQGAIAATRWELEYRDEAACSLLDAQMMRRWGPVWSERLVQFADFRIRSSDTNTSRTSRAHWFAELVGNAKRAKVYDPSPPKTLEDSESWLLRQVARSFAKVLAGHGGDLDFVSKLAAAGKARFTAHDRMLIDQALGGAA